MHTDALLGWDEGFPGTWMFSSGNGKILGQPTQFTLGFSEPVFWCPDFPRDEREGVSGGRRSAADRRLTFRHVWDEIKLPGTAQMLLAMSPMQEGMVRWTASQQSGRELRFMEYAVLCRCLVKIAVSNIQPDCDSMRQTTLSHLRRLELCSVLLCPLYNGAQLQTWRACAGAWDSSSLC